MRDKIVCLCGAGDKLGRERIARQRCPAPADAFNHLIAADGKSASLVLSGIDNGVVDHIPRRLPSLVTRGILARRLLDPKRKRLY